VTPAGPERFRILPGLPATGPPAVPFTCTPWHEGFVVEFFPKAGPSWVGNFGGGGSRYTAVLSLPRDNELLVIVSGAAHVVDIERRELLRTFGSYICGVLPAPEANLLILNCGAHLEAYDADAANLVWRTRGLSWDGIEDLRIEQGQIRGFGRGPNRLPLIVDLKTGGVEEQRKTYPEMCK
jgi:hypothetical protein